MKHRAFKLRQFSCSHNPQFIFFCFKENKRLFLGKPNVKESILTAYIKQNISKGCAFAFILMTVPTTLFQPFKVIPFVKEALLSWEQRPNSITVPCS